MPRTKQVMAGANKAKMTKTSKATSVKKGSGVSKKGRKPGLKTKNDKLKKITSEKTPKHRWKNGTVALRMIRKEQKNSGCKFAIPYVAFRRIVREALNSVTPAGSEFRIGAGTIDALQEASEEMMTNIFSKANLLTTYVRKDVTVKGRELKFAAAEVLEPHRFSTSTIHEKAPEFTVTENGAAFAELSFAKALNPDIAVSRRKRGAGANGADKTSKTKTEASKIKAASSSDVAKEVDKIAGEVDMEKETEVAKNESEDDDDEEDLARTAAGK